MLVGEGSHVNVTRGGKHQTWTEWRERGQLDTKITYPIFPIHSLWLSPWGLSHFLARRKQSMSFPLSSMYPIGSETMTSTMSGQATSSISPSRTLIRSDRQLLSIKTFRGDNVNAWLEQSNAQRGFSGVLNLSGWKVFLGIEIKFRIFSIYNERFVNTQMLILPEK